MSARDDGGPAFPSHGLFLQQGEKAVQHPGPPGMTLRDYFAAAALHDLVDGYQNYAVDEDIERVAATAYKVADAMLAERAK